MNFIKTKNFKNMLNSFYDSVTAGTPTEFSNDADVDHGHNVITIGGITANGKIYTADSATEQILQFASDGSELRGVYSYQLVDGNLVQFRGGGSDYRFTPTGTINNISNVRGKNVRDGFYDPVNGNLIGTNLDGNTIIFVACTDDSMDDDKNSPSGSFKILTPVGTSVYNKGKNVYTLIDNENGVITAKSIMVLFNGDTSYYSGHNWSPVLIGGAVLDNPITLGNGVTATIEIDWGLNQLT